MAEIAERRLTPAAQSAASTLLALEGHRHLDEIASWADAYHADHPETGKWHFVDIPLDAAGYDAARDCLDGNCVIGRLLAFTAELRDQHASPDERLTALKYVVHFIGDIHQPLHCADRHDRGGNDLQLVYAGQPSNLHAIWDLGMIETELHTSLGPNWTPDLAVTQAAAANLAAAITPQQAAAWAPTGMQDHLAAATVIWADEAHELARDAYRRLPQTPRPGWEADYDRAEWPVVELQLERAGIRLAAVLNATLGPP